MDGGGGGAGHLDSASPNNQHQYTATQDEINGRQGNVGQQNRGDCERLGKPKNKRPNSNSAPLVSCCSLSLISSLFQYTTTDRRRCPGT